MGRTPPSRTSGRKKAARSAPASATASAQSPPARTSAAKLKIVPSPGFAAWLAAANAGLVFSAYKTGKVFLVGVRPDGRLSIVERSFDRCMGLSAHENGFYLAALYQLWRFENILDPGGTYDGYDRAYLPLVGHTTGLVDIHDIAVPADGRVVFVNTRFNCLATIGERESFIPLWRPPFISKLVAEDRCHLNGMALDGGRPAFVTARAATDVADGWRDKSIGDGLVMDVRTDQIVAQGLSQPHSPRVHGGRLWLLNSGTGEIGWIDPRTRAFAPLAFCPGYLRGLAFVGDQAIVGMSKPREHGMFADLPLDEGLRRRGLAPRCGLAVVDLKTGEIRHALRIEGVVEELYDVIVLPGARRPMAFGFKSDDIQKVVRIGHPPSPSTPRPSRSGRVMMAG